MTQVFIVTFSNLDGVQLVRAFDTYEAASKIRSTDHRLDPDEDDPDWDPEFTTELFGPEIEVDKSDLAKQLLEEQDDEFLKEKFK